MQNNIGYLQSCNNQGKHSTLFSMAPICEQQRWARIRTEANFCRTGLDRTEKIFLLVMWLFWTYQKFQLSLDFTDLYGSVYLAINGKSSAETNLQFELDSPLSTYNAGFL